MTPSQRKQATVVSLISSMWLEMRRQWDEPVISVPVGQGEQSLPLAWESSPGYVVGEGKGKALSFHVLKTSQYYRR